jgi:hypothetical protein
MASIDWEAVAGAHLAGSASETQMLALAAGIACCPTTLPLAELLSVLDDANGLLVLRAFHHARRGHEGQSVIVAPFYDDDT